MQVHIVEWAGSCLHYLVMLPYYLIYFRLETNVKRKVRASHALGADHPAPCAATRSWRTPSLLAEHLSLLQSVREPLHGAALAWAILPKNPWQLPVFLHRSSLDGWAMRGADYWWENWGNFQWMIRWDQRGAHLIADHKLRIQSQPPAHGANYPINCASHHSPSSAPISQARPLRGIVPGSSRITPRLTRR
jgi:hypothetical protein